MASLGIDIGGGSVKIAVRGAGGAGAFRTGRSGQYAKPTPDVLRDAIAAAARSAGWDGRETLGGVGVCLPGVLDDRRQALAASANLPDLVGAPLTPLLNDALGTPALPSVTFLSDANATAYDVYLDRGFSGRLFLLAIGTGVGAAVIDEGPTLLRVSGDSPGHFGQLDVSLTDDPPVGPDGGAGGLEAYLSAAALAPRYGADPLIAAASLRADDPPLRALARAIRIAHALYRPHHVCLAGGVGLRLAHALPMLRHRVEDRLTFLARPAWTLSVAAHEFHAASGAARFAERSSGGGGVGPPRTADTEAGGGE